KSGLPNFHNAFNMTFESRYVSGIVAGMKLKELMDAGKVTDPYIGYVGAFPYAEVVSGFTGFFLGIKSIVPNAHMDVQYTNSWFDIQEEGKAAEALMARGCVIIGQHADSTGAPKAVQTAKDNGAVVYSVGYNIDMLAAAPTAALTSSTNDWSVYYTYLFNAFLKGEKIATDWAKGYDEGAVAITPLGPEVAPGTAEAVAAAEAAIKAGKLHVFDTKTFTVEGKELTHAFTFDSDGDFVPDTNEGIVDGYYHESEYISAPSFGMIIDGITPLN
ncbi:MAG: BMP family ABC transporter substrate-binding protein, partial [Oscillospiraceae bacterium]|nr:BMP family ABC transporter substrate-binding protein [Oscillospiraceae bacterium]